jgi:hypothetical protein
MPQCVCDLDTRVTGFHFSNDRSIHGKGRSPHVPIEMTEIFQPLFWFAVGVIAATPLVIAIAREFDQQEQRHSA